MASGSAEKLVSSPGRKWSAEGQIGMATWLPMVGGHQSVAKGVGERVEQPEGLYLGCQPRYSCKKRLPG